MPKTLIGAVCFLLLGLSWPLIAAPLRVIGDNNYPPYLFIGPDGKPQGYVVDEWALFERKTGIRVELVPTHWADAQRRMRAGQADVIDMIFRTPARATSLDFSDPYARVNVGIYADRELTGIAGPEGLKGFVVGVERGDACVDHLRNAGVSTLRLYTGYADIIAAARAGDIRIFCMDRLPAEYYLYRLGVHDAFVKAFDFYSDAFRRAVHKGDAATLALVERGMARITPEEREQLRRKWMGRHVDLAGYAPILEAVVSGLAVLGTILLVWVYSLRRAVRRRTRDLEFLARYDPLTSLPNRQTLLDRIDHAVAQPGARLAVLLVDLDHFKRINDRFGHPLGDKLLQEIARRLQALPGLIDTVARLSGDDFVLTATTTDVGQLTAIAEQAREAVARVHALDEQEVVLGASIGVSVHPHDGTDGVTLLKNADSAMSRAKQSGRNTICFYRASLSTQASRLITIGAALRKAIDRNEFELLYQPQYDLRTDQLVGVEALVRWRRGTVLVPPSDFIPCAEELGLIDELGAWVLQTACRQLAAWPVGDRPGIHMAVNLSPRQLSSPGLLPAIEEALARASLPAKRLHLEIVESALVAPGQEIDAVLQAIRGLGVHIAIDDFGTGYSSLAYLRHLPVSVVKIDKSFLDDVPQDGKAGELVGAIVAMAHALKLAVVAEGVEAEPQAAFLRQVGCEFAQGWLHGRPVPPDRIAALL